MEGYHLHNFILETDRLILRPLTVADAETVFIWRSDPEHDLSGAPTK